MLVAYGYTRISPREGVLESLSPKVQAQTIESYCKFKGWNLEKTFSDIGVSGGKLLGLRKQGKALLEALIGPVSRIVCARQDRLFRNNQDAVNTIALWRKIGVLPVCIAEGLDLSTPAGRLMFHMMAAMGEYERELIGERTRAVMTEKKKRGERVSRYAPYGWDFTPEGILVENPREMKTFQWIKNMRSRGHSDRKIAQMLNEKGIPSKSGGKWGSSSVKSILETTRPPRKKQDEEVITNEDLKEIFENAFSRPKKEDPSLEHHKEAKE